ncbi:AAA family ATPase [Acidithiobacillus caldus]|uniref:AAA family ATPase n=1 Tax=Acidithiobacillus caldus TaxID=33059 RepID=UPI001C077940|nr:AAA family ATPase [Acidithiobacillus caldus]MBU2801693.1 AAA family ATPase [Acidithiobacillus caldus]
MSTAEERVKRAFEDQAPKRLLVDVSTILKHPPATRWLVRDLIPAGSFAVIFGQAAHGKSFVTLDVMACVATGHPFHGSATTKGIAAYFCGEGFSGIGRRLAAWQEATGQKLAGRMFASASIPPILEGGEETIVEELTALPAPPGVIGIDTVSRALGGSDENSSQDMAAFVAACDRIRASVPGSTLIAVHHSGWGDKGRARGSSVLRAAVDLELAVAKDDSGQIWLTSTKSKDTEPPKPRAFVLRTQSIPWADDDGRPMSSAVLELVPDAEAAATSEATKKLGEWQRIALAVLQAMCAEAKANVIEAGIGSIPRVELKDWRAKLKEQGFNGKWPRLVDTLEERGLIQVDGLFVRTKP